MPYVEASYARGDRFLVQVRDHHLVVDQPKEAGGDDVGPTPTELFVASLAACIGFYAERFFRHHGIPAEGLKVEADFEMAHRPARVGSVGIRVVLPEGFPVELRSAVEGVVERCTLHNTLAMPPLVRIALVERVPSAA